jgi:dienelactone hydrolase
MAFVAIPLLAAVGAAWAADDYLRAAAFVIRAAGMHGVARTIADSRTVAVREERVALPTRSGDVPARIYSPATVSQRRVLLVPGVHAAGVDEPRLDGFARNLAAMGHPVLTVGPPDLARYRISPASTDVIEDAARWWMAGAGPIGIVGISFAGGLSIVAASRIPEIAWVLSFGGHGDLPRTLRYLCTGIEPGGARRPPHDYGVVIILLGVAPLVVPAPQVAALRAAILSFLEASHLDMVDKPAAAHVFERAKRETAALPEPARTYMQWVNERNVEKLGAALLPHVAALGGDPELSPARAAPPRGVVYLLHGADDNVVPAAESALLERDLKQRGGTAFQLATPLITHAEVDRSPTAAEVWQLVRFWAGPL